MCRNLTERSFSRLLLALALLAALPAAAWAQAGRITGTVTDPQLAPIAGAQVSVVGTQLGTLSDASGRFTLDGVPAGAQQLRVQYTGYAASTVPVAVQAGQTAAVDVQLQSEAIQLNAVVVSASRREQRLTEAPATVTRIGADVLENAVGNTWVAALKEAKGVDFIQVGMTGVALNARGFNSSFNNRMLMMEDGRIAVLPENGLPVGSFTAVPKIDLAGVEVLVGPGAALYGADASSGVVTLISKDPRQFPGTSVEITGGNNSYKDIQFRHAGVAGNWGFKVAGEFQDTDDFADPMTYHIGVTRGAAPVPVREDQMGVNSIDWTNQVIRGTGTLVRYFQDGQLDLSVGASQTDGVGQTNVGRNQLRDWGYNFQQARFASERWYLNAYRAQSSSGESFALNRYADAFARNPGADPEELRLASDWPSDGQMYATELQNNFEIPAALGTRIVWGGQFRRDVVSSDRQWLSDRLTGEDIQINQYGAYAQSETPLTSWLDVVLAGRVDKHDNYETQFSPKAALIFKPAEDHALRVTYNRAFKSPTTLQTNFWIPDWNPVVAIYGNTQGFEIRNAAGATVRSVAPLAPEENVTYEIGYKGVLGGRAFVDVAGYYSDYENFLSPLSIISNPYAGETATFAYDAAGQMYKTTAGLPALALTYFNLGAATVYGTDAGINYYLSDRVKLKGTVGWLKVDELDDGGSPEATSLNAPNTKFTLGADFTDIGSFLDGKGNFTGGFLVRHTNSYYFRSGINFGVIPTFTTLDLSAGYKIPQLSSTLQVGISNLFTCSQNEDAPLQYADALRTTPTNKEGQCGFGLRHQEMINMPAVGTMVFVGLRWNR